MLSRSRKKDKGLRLFVLVLVLVIAFLVAIVWYVNNDNLDEVRTITPSTATDSAKYSLPDK